MQKFIWVWGVMFCLLMGGCEEKIGPGQIRPGAQKKVPVHTAVVRLDTRRLQYEAVGTVRARLFSTLSSKVVGTVSQVKVHEADRVKRGQVLLVLTQQQIHAGYQQARAALDEARRAQAAAEAALKSAQAQAGLAKATYDRYQKLVAGESASPQELDEVKARHLSAQAAFHRARSMALAAENRVGLVRAALDGAAATSGDTVLRAPYDGVITEKRVEPGDLASPGLPLLRMEALEGFRAVFVLEETQIGDLHSGQALEAELPALGNRRVTGTVEAVMPAADAATRSIEVKLTLPDVPGLRSGLFVRVFIPGPETRILRIPESAVVRKGQLTGLYKVDKTHTIRFRLIRLGSPLEGGTVEVLSGLKPGDRFVLVPGPQVVDGVLAQEAA
jgi:membrane fusion protein, multidrug efflux system